MANRPTLLLQLIDQAKRTPVQVIFDLDSTLFDVSPRITKIIHNFAKLPEVVNKWPQASNSLLKLEAHPSDYGVKKTLIRHQFTPPDQEFIMKLVEFWKKQFFSSEFLYLDLPYAGSVDFVNDLHKAGGEIYYLTGRDIPRMLQGTVNSMKAHNFPLNSDHANLILKPNTDITDAEFKRDFFGRMTRKNNVWFFENEPKNIHLVVERYPEIQVVFVDTVHSGKDPEPGQKIPRLKGYLEP